MNVRGIQLQGHWTPDELAAVRRTLDPIPAPWLEKNPSVLSIIRQDALQGAPASAPGHSKYDQSRRAIVVFDKGVYHAGSRRIDEEQFKRSVLHELAHTLLLRFPEWIKRWGSETKNDGFVDEYAKTNPDEDFADTFSEFFIQPNETKRKAPKKYAFISDRLTQAQRDKVAMVNLNSFSDEVFEKVARFGLPGGLLGKAGKMPRGIKMGLLGGAGAGAYAHGQSKGRKRGVAEGTAATNMVAQRAYKVGVMRGAVAMRQHILDRMNKTMGAGSSSSKK
jgi:hypothetical protein